MRGCGPDRLGRGLLHDLARVHHHQPVTDLQQQRQVVRDEDDAEPEFLAEPLDLVQDLPLHHHIQRGGRLVHDDDLRLERERHRDHDALPHAAGQLVREAIDPGRVDPDHVEQIPPPRMAGGAVHVRPVGFEDVIKLAGQAGHRVEGVHRALEDHRDLVPPELAQVLTVQRHHVHRRPAGGRERDRPGGQLGGRPEHPGQRVGQRGLAAPALAGDAQHLAAAQLDRHVTNGPGGAAPGVLDADVLRAQDHVVTGGRPVALEAWNPAAHPWLTCAGARLALAGR